MANFGSPGNPNLRDLPRATISPMDAFRLKGVATLIREQIKAHGGVSTPDIPEALGMPTKTILVHLRKGTLTLHDLLIIADTFPEVSIDAALKVFAFGNTEERNKVRADEARLDAPGYAEKRLEAVISAGQDPLVAEIARKYGASL